MAKSTVHAAKGPQERASPLLPVPSAREHELSLRRARARPATSNSNIRVVLVSSQLVAQPREMSHSLDLSPHHPSEAADGLSPIDTVSLGPIAFSRASGRRVGLGTEAHVGDAACEFLSFVRSSPSIAPMGVGSFEPEVGKRAWLGLRFRV